MNRLTALIGAILIFAAVYMVVGFIILHAVEGVPDWTSGVAIALAGCVALLAALCSYGASMVLAARKYWLPLHDFRCMPLMQRMSVEPLRGILDNECAITVDCHLAQPCVQTRTSTNS
jgi:hypothetical protein